MINVSKEVKFSLQDNPNIIKELKRKQAVLVGAYKEKTIRYDDKYESLEKRGKFIRVRSGLKNIISIKEKIEDDDEQKVFKRNEIEVEIGDIKKMQYILENIGLKETYTMEKYRLKWQYDDAEINLDELPFGLFLEIHGEEGKIEKVSNELGLNKNNIIIGTYWDIFEKYKIENNISDKIKNIEFGDGYSYKLAQ